MRYGQSRVTSLVYCFQMAQVSGMSDGRQGLTLKNSRYYTCHGILNGVRKIPMTLV